MTLVIGSEGSMGKRYQAICKFLKEDFKCYDPALPNNGTFPDEFNFDRFIIASPTSTHADWVKSLDRYRKPILCEKPLSKSKEEIADILECKSPLTMTMQYAYLYDRHSFGRTYYNYYHHGQDGLIWDCFQIIALAHLEVDLKEDSPVWTCLINGKALNRRDMDQAYVEMVRSWLHGLEHPKSILREWHDKVLKYEEKCNSSLSA